jgi:hypothetical protein
MERLSDAEVGYISGIAMACTSESGKKLGRDFPRKAFSLSKIIF